jgi:hypothetical protein
MKKYREPKDNLPLRRSNPESFAAFKHVRNRLPFLEYVLNVFPLDLQGLHPKRLVECQMQR